MAHISADLIFDSDFLNFTITNANAAPKIKPAWKVRTAPKLPPKQKALPQSSVARPAPRPKINTSRFQNQTTEKNQPKSKEARDNVDSARPVRELESSEDDQAIPSTPSPSTAKPAAAPKRKNFQS